jgi:hypothetical protein
MKTSWAKARNLRPRATCVLPSGASDRRVPSSRALGRSSSSLGGSLDLMGRPESKKFGQVRKTIENAILWTSKALTSAI